MSELRLPLPKDVAHAIAQLAAEIAVERLRNEAAARPRMLTIKEAAEELRAKPQRVYDLLSDGRLTRHKDGARVLVDREELNAYLGIKRRGVDL